MKMSPLFCYIYQVLDFVCILYTSIICITARSVLLSLPLVITPQLPVATLLPLNLTTPHPLIQQSLMSLHMFASCSPHAFTRRSFPIYFLLLMPACMLSVPMHWHLCIVHTQILVHDICSYFLMHNGVHCISIFLIYVHARLLISFH